MYVVKHTDKYKLNNIFDVSLQTNIIIVVNFSNYHNKKKRLNEEKGHYCHDNQQD